MKKVSRKPLLILLIAGVLLSMLFFSYRVYHAYRNYQLVQSSDLYIDLIQHLDTTLKQFENERLISALYLGYNGKIEFTPLAQKRQESDKALKDLITYIKNDPHFSKIEHAFENIEEDLRYARSRIDIINEDYNNLLVGYYQNRIITPLLQQTQQWLLRLSQSIGSVAIYFTTSKELITQRDNLNLEQSYIAYFLAGAKKMQMQDLLTWENILKNEQIPYLDRLSQKPIYSLLTQSLHKDMIQNSTTTLRRAVLKGIGSGNYTVNTNQWIGKMQQNIDFTEETQKTLFDYLKSLDFKGIIPVALYLNILAIAVSLGVLIILLKWYKKPLPLSERTIKDENPDIKIKHVANEHTIAKHQVQPPLPESFSPTDPHRNTIAIEEIDDDLPLTNIVSEEENPDIHEEATETVAEAIPKIEEEHYEESTFSPIQLFKEIIKPYISRSIEKNISFHYAIDPALPDICLGDREKIKEILTLILDPAMKAGITRKEVTLRIENIAQKKFETAISFTIKDSGTYIPQEERSKIRRGILDTTHHNPLTEVFSSDYATYLKAANIVKQLGGSIQIQSDHTNGTEFIISINLKKFLSTEE